METNTKPATGVSVADNPQMNPCCGNCPYGFETPDGDHVDCHYWPPIAFPVPQRPTSGCPSV